MSSVNDKKGFSGLSSLVSDINEVVSESPHRATQPETRVSDTRRDTVSKRESAPHPVSWSQKWLPGLVGLVVLLWLIGVKINDEDDRSPTTVSSYTQPSPSPSNSPSQTSGAPISDLESPKSPVEDDNTRDVSPQRSQLTLDIQSTLMKLGYNPGPLDGLYGARTKAAIQSFQREIGVVDDGQVTQELLNTLIQEINVRGTRDSTMTTGSVVPTPTRIMHPASENKEYFARNSHEKDVLLLQGPPSNVARYEALGYETWYFGNSTVDIHFQTRRVLGWNNEGNLKVQLLPGDQTTISTVFTRESHEDDVLRLQGTPSDIKRYEALGYERWYFGYSTVMIDFRTREVLGWDNEGNLNVQLLPGDQTTTSTAFTRGSHEDDVLRLQGTPSDITRYEALGYERWYFGHSTVTIDFRTREVLGWDNEGNLNVQFLPGDQITTSTAFTRGSHEDDVLRLQGTPSAIAWYEALGYEIWNFAYSTVKIDSRTHRVLGWGNNGGNLKVQE